MNHRTRQRLVDAAARLLDAPAEQLTIIVARGHIEIVHPEPPLRPSHLPEGVSTYDAAILRAIADKPMSSARIARISGHPLNSYFRERLSALVEIGHVRHMRRGYFLPG